MLNKPKPQRRLSRLPKSKYPRLIFQILMMRISQTRLKSPNQVRHQQYPRLIFQILMRKTTQMNHQMQSLMLHNKFLHQIFLIYRNQLTMGKYRRIHRSALHQKSNTATEYGLGPQAKFGTTVRYTARLYRCLN